MVHHDTGARRARAVLTVGLVAQSGSSCSGSTAARVSDDGVQRLSRDVAELALPFTKKRIEFAHGQARRPRRQAAATLSDRLNIADIANRIVWPIHGDDFNDDLQRGATAADYERPAGPDAGDAAGAPCAWAS